MKVQTALSCDKAYLQQSDIRNDKLETYDALIIRCNNGGCTEANKCIALVFDSIIILFSNYDTVHSYVTLHWRSNGRMIGNLALQVSIKKVEPHSHGDHNILQPSQVYHGERTLVCQGMARDGNRSPLVDGAMVRDYRIHIATLLMEPLWLRGQSMVSIDGNSYGQV